MATDEMAGNKNCGNCFWILTPLVEDGRCRKSFPDVRLVVLKGERSCSAHRVIPQFLTTVEAVEFALKYYRVRITKETLVNWCKSGKVPARQFGGRTGNNRYGKWRIYDLKKFKEILNAEV